MTFLFWGGGEGLELGDASVPREGKPSKALDGTLLLKLGLDNSSVSNLVKIGLPGRKALGQTQECGLEGGKSQSPGTGLAWSGPPPRRSGLWLN